MTTVEEQLWDYIDGSCTAIERSAIEAKIATDENYKAIYEEFLALNLQMAQIELDEPPMAFNRNIMEMVKLETAPVSLKTKIDNRIIYGIAAFFILSALAIFIYAVTYGNLEMPATVKKMNFAVDLDRFITPASIKIFLFADLVIGFLYLDTLLRRKKQVS